MNLKEYIGWVLNWKIDGQKIISDCFEKAKKSLDEKENIYLRTNNIQWTTNDWFLKWAPIAIKDNIMQKGEISTCWSKILQDYVATYSATCIENLEKNGWVVIWSFITWSHSKFIHICFSYYNSSIFF